MKLEPSQVLAVLETASTIRSAVYRLKTSESTLRKYCRQAPELRKAYDLARDRGLAKAASTRHDHFFLQSMPVVPYLETK